MNMSISCSFLMIRCGCIRLKKNLCCSFRKMNSCCSRSCFRSWNFLCCSFLECQMCFWCNLNCFFRWMSFWQG